VPLYAHEAFQKPRETTTTYLLKKPPEGSLLFQKLRENASFSSNQ